MDPLSQFLDWLSTLSFGGTVVLVLTAIGVILTILLIINDYIQSKKNGDDDNNQ